MRGQECAMYGCTLKHTAAPIGASYQRHFDNEHVAADKADPKAALDKAIKAYYAQTDPDVYVDGWILLTHKFSPDLEAEGSVAVGIAVAEGQSFALTRGMLDIALSTERSL